ncbi:Phosphoethanolamine-cytidyltransferase, partial [Cardiosporidium cionae]
MASTKNSSPFENTDVDIRKLIAFYNQIASDSFLSKQLKSLHSTYHVSTPTDERLQTEVAAEVSAIRSFLKNGGAGPHFPDAEGDCRIYADGVFDLIHSGHFNAFRQAKAMGDRLVVGINSDEEVRTVKGSLTIYNEEERAEIVRACKWVDEVIIGTPYAVTIDFLNSVKCHFAAHGDDMAVGVNGVDCYSEPRAANRLKIFKRTEGISSTALVSRLLVATERLRSSFACSQPTTIHQFVEENLRSKRMSRQTLTSTKRLLEFISPPKQPKPTDTR